MEGPWEHNYKRLLDSLEEEGIDTVILVSPQNILYTTGIREPGGAAVLSRNCGYTLIVPLLEYHRVNMQSPRYVELKAAYRGSEEGIEPDIPRRDVIAKTPVKAAIDIAKECGGKVAADLQWAPYPAARELIDAGVTDSSRAISRLRSIKTSAELDLISKAVDKAQEILSKVLSLIEEGVSEAWMAGEIVREALVRGWGPSFPPIVAFYSNTAYPHHTPGTTILGNPGPILIDLGVVHEGYMSDMTRTLYYGKPGRVYSRIFESVLEAQSAAIDRIGPGVEAWEPDKEARLVLQREGLVKYFNHGLGHGVGVEIHEEPYLRPGSKTVLEPGMVVTVEPGVYIQGVLGVRIEDLVLVTPGGRRLLTRFTRVIDLAR
ncbi:MAG: Xaa-Pro peptidase family protein [Desulfurococcales archaeon]|nr:Xaa-Pro peptidase family protein [Desulfurococcales archaeon]